VRTYPDEDAAHRAVDAWGAEVIGVGQDPTSRRRIVDDASDSDAGAFVVSSQIDAVGGVGLRGVVDPTLAQQACVLANPPRAAATTSTTASTSVVNRFRRRTVTRCPR
jgi:hypothetical protein